MIISPQWALAAGIVLSFVAIKKPNIQFISKLWASRLLQGSVILLGSSLNFSSVIEQGTGGLFVTLISIVSVFLFGYIAMLFFKIDQKLAILLTMGTAICGGSAIGALAPVLAAESVIITVAIAIVFSLNTIAVFIFPLLGNFLQLTQSDFGVWAALAIHDTSSVVAASSLFGEEALKVATTLKLTRALWIIPITLIFSILWKRKENKITIPWFVLGFLGMSLCFTFISPLIEFQSIFFIISKTGFAITLFLIGLSFDMTKMKKIGIKPFAFALTLWMIVTIISLIYIKVS